MMAMSDQVNTAPVTHGLRAAATGQKEKMIYSLTGASVCWRLIAVTG